jgi:replicative DNA helicase
VGNKIIASALDESSEPEDAAAEALALLSRKASKQDAQARQISDALGEAYSRMETLRTENRSIALTSGWETFDSHKVFGPTLVVIGGPSKSGKSSLMIDLAESFAINSHKSAMFSLESSEIEIGLRYTSARTGIPHSRMRDWRTFSDADFTRVAACRAEARKKGIFLTDRSFSIDEITLETRRLRAVEGIDAILIDYAQEVESKYRNDQRGEERIGDICRILRKTAVELSVCVILFSQINEDAWEKRGFGRLYIRDLSHARVIGKIARTVVFMHRPEKVNPTGKFKDCNVTIQIEANNEERTHPGFEAHFNEATQRFAEGGCAANGCRSLGAEQTVQRKLI